MTEDPAVLAWRMALAPRPRYSTGGRHWWRDLCAGVLQDAEDAWQALRESGHSHHNGSAYHQLSDDEFKAAFPRPTLKAVLTDLRGCHRDPYELVNEKESA